MKEIERQRPTYKEIRTERKRWRKKEKDRYREYKQKEKYNVYLNNYLHKI